MRFALAAEPLGKAACGSVLRRPVKLVTLSMKHIS